MIKSMKSILFVVCVVMLFTAQTKRPDDKGQQHAQGARPAQARPVETRPAQARPAQARTRTEAPRNNQSRPNVQMPHIEVPQPLVERRAMARQDNGGPRVYAVPEPPPTQDNQLFHRQHHNHWQPLYNFYDGQYHFYPYVNVTSPVELSANFVSVGFQGENYYYDQGSFYVQTPQGYLAAPPPVGIIVNALPSWARQVNIDGQIYYRCKGAFYIQVDQGYQVVAAVQQAAGE